MVVGGPGGGELEGGTAALRQLMLRAAEDDAARAEALGLIAQRRVLVATWPHSPESVRTLTNSDGEQAMPLFSGLDVLLDAAHRFGWMGPDGSVSHRELGAAEALRSAVANGVHFVVLDICMDWVVEFGRDEVGEALRALPQAEQAPVRGPRGPVVSVAPPPPRRVSKRPHEGTTPIVKMQPATATLSAAIVEESVAPRGRVTRPDPRVEPSMAKQLAVVSVARVPQALLQARQQPSPVAFAPAPPVAAPIEFAAPPSAVAAVSALPSLDDASPFAGGGTPAFALPSLGSVPPLPTFEVPSNGLGTGLGTDLGAAFAAPSDEPQARPAALEAAAMVTQVAKMSKDAGTQQAAREVATMLKDMATQGTVEESASSSAVKSAANVLVAMLGASVEAAAAKKKKRRAPKPLSSGDVAAVAEAAPTPPPAPASEQGADAEARGLRPLTEPLADALLSQIADALRKYPEVEWACEVSDGTQVAVIGVRVEPTFLTRVPEIKAAVVKASGAHRVALTMLVLDDPQQMREARAQGTLFFPWRKRAAGAKR